MSILESAKKALEDRLGGEAFDGSVKFEIEGEGALRVDESGVAISDDEADCTLTADADVFEDMMSGNLNPTSAFMTGRLRVDGDMSMAMKLGALLS